jgi:flavodoxin
MFFDVVLYWSKGKKSSLVAKEFGIPILSVIDNPNLDRYKNMIIVCPTYGDEELPFEMEDFLIKLRTTEKKFAVCELGNFFGHEKEFGAAKIIKFELEKRKWECVDSLSLDSFPEIDWFSLKKWKKKLLEK